MKKIILMFNGTEFPQGAFDFVSNLNEIEQVLLVGAYWPHAELSNWRNYADNVGGMFIPMPEEPNLEDLQNNIHQFEKLCLHNGIEFRLHEGSDTFVISELRKESQFADLVLLGSEIFHEYLEDALHELLCPVVIVPEKALFPKSIVLAYDGSDESIFAIKQFAQLFPNFLKLETTLVYADMHPDKDFPDKILLEELLARHYTKLNLTKVNIDPRKYFKNWISDNNSIILVCGSYGRSAISLLIKHSFIRDLINEHQFPIFIAHK